MSTIPDRNPPIFSPKVLGGIIKPGPRYGAMQAFHGRQLAADQASHIVSYRNAVEAYVHATLLQAMAFNEILCRKRVALPRASPRVKRSFLSTAFEIEHIGDTKLGAWRASNAYNMETNRRIIAGKGIF